MTSYVCFARKAVVRPWRHAAWLAERSDEWGSVESSSRCRQGSGRSRLLDGRARHVSV